MLVIVGRELGILVGRELLSGYHENGSGLWDLVLEGLVLPTWGFDAAEWMARAHR